MELSLSKQNNRRLARAIVEFDLINDNDNIVVGFSGGKDSSFLLYALKTIQDHVNINFEFSAITVEPFFQDDFDYSPLENFCKKLGVKHYRKEINKNIKSPDEFADNLDNPCSKCSYFRKGAIVEFMKENNFNKLAYGHHYDDAVETFLMSQLYSGQIKTFPPKRILPKNDVSIIRPLIYIREKYIREVNKTINYQPIDSSCPYDGHTKRDRVKEILQGLPEKRQVFYNLASAMREGNKIELWPEEQSEEAIYRRLEEFWQ